MNRDREIEERRYRRLKRWYRSLPPDKRGLSMKFILQAEKDGLVDDNGLTPAGRLKLHQLELLGWWANSERAKRDQNIRASSSGEGSPIHDLPS